MQALAALATSAILSEKRGELLMNICHLISPTEQHRMAAEAIRKLSREAVFTLSHVHIPVHQAHLFESAAKWILPHCR